MKKSFLPNKVNTIETHVIETYFMGSDGDFKERKTLVTSIDFIVDGQSLFEILQAEENNLVGTFSPRWKNGKETAKIFLQKKKPDLEDGRVLIYCCAVCGDIDCGGITVKMIQEGDFIKWFDFADNYGDSNTTKRQFQQKIGPFYFKFGDYSKVIKTAVSQCRTS